MNQQRGSTLVGFIIGLVVGLTVVQFKYVERRVNY